MRVLFVYPNLTHQENINFGLAYLSAMLKQAGHETGLFDFTWNGSRRFLPFAKSFQPDLIAVTVQSGVADPCAKLVRSVKKNLGIPVIVGGVHPTILPNYAFDTAGADFACVGEGENTMIGLVECLESKKSLENVPNLAYREDGRVHVNATSNRPENLDALPFPDRDLYDFSRYIRGASGGVDLLVSRGCPHTCTYCVNHVYHRLHPKKKRVRRRSVENVLREIENMARRHRFERLHIQDDAFTLNKPYVIEFCKQYKKLFNYGFSCNSRAESVDPEVCRALKDAGCLYINIGIENGNEKLRKDVLNRRMTNRQIEDAFEAARGAGLKTYSFNMIGVPGETAETIRETIELNRKVRPNLVQVSIFQPYPGTKLQETCEKNGWIQEKPLPISHKSKSVMRYPGLSARSINRRFKTFRYDIYKTYNRPKALFSLALDSQYNLFLKTRSLIPKPVKDIMAAINRK